MNTTENAELLKRAKAGYHRADEGNQTVTGGEVIERDGLTYVVLAGLLGTLAVYRVRHNGPLRRLRRWPADLKLPESPIDVSTDRLHQAVKIADRLIVAAPEPLKKDLSKLLRLIAKAGHELDSLDASADEAHLRAAWGIA
ncbi:hypothetical protein ACSFBI_01405 [Variovorax sp. RB3P1]|uniref:hypothetical protein n=1 Tax=Variovorax sp. RB3P1 TaxID=3443732 RepID=UPI003F46EBA1